MIVCKYICSELNLEYKSDQFYDVFHATVDYLVGVTNAFDYQSSLKELVNFKDLELSAKDFRLELIRHNKGHLGLRMLCLNLIKTNKVTKENLVQWTNVTKVAPCDAIACHKIYCINGIKYKARRSERVSSIPKHLTHCSQLTQIDQMLQRIWPKVMTTIKRTTYTKLRFISSSTNTDFKDLHSDLQVKALHAFYKLMPTCQPEAYVINYVRRAVTNHANNVISACTTQKRGRLVKAEADGFGGNNFTLRVASENQLNINMEDNEVIQYDSMMSLDLQLSTMLNEEIQFSVQQVLDRYRHLRRKNRFLRIMFGQEDREFSEWLVNKGYTKDNDNTVYQDSTDPAEFVSTVGQFLRVPERSLQAFMCTIRQHFVGHGNTLYAR